MLQAPVVAAAGWQRGFAPWSPGNMLPRRGPVPDFAPQAAADLDDTMA